MWLSSGQARLSLMSSASRLSCSSEESGAWDGIVASDLGSR
jgi:hypothetical protein